MAINTGKVVAGGLAAGVVMNVIDYVTQNIILKEQFAAQMNALNPAIMAKVNSSGGAVWFIALDFVAALLLVWTYAAIRPRFGAGAGTAAKTAVLFWLFGGSIWAMVTVMGIISWSLWAMSGCAYLVNLLASAYVGGMIYKEE